MSLAALLAIVILELLPTPTATASADPYAGRHAFAAYLIGGFFGLGLIMFVAFLFSRKPRSARK